MTPIRRQYLRIKQRYPDAIVLFRLGDFYETFDDDAKLASRELDIVLTSRNMGRSTRVPMAGIPAHAMEGYLARLIRRGHKVAICEQITDPAASKGLVERDVVRVVTPGTVVEPSLLEQKANNYLAAVAVEEDQAGLAYADVTTGEFAVTQVPVNSLALEVERLSPAEILIPQGQEPSFSTGDGVISSQDVSIFHPREAEEVLLDHFGVLTLEAFGCQDSPLAVRAAGALVDYLGRTQKAALAQLTHLRTYNTRGFMALDPQTRRNLELFRGGRPDSPSPSLLSVLDLTRTALGGRMLRRWLGQPLVDLKALLRRQEAVEFFYRDNVLRQQALSILSRISDLERIENRVRLGTSQPRELLSLKASIEAASELRELLGAKDDSGIAWAESGIPPKCDDLTELIGKSIESDPTGEPGEGGVIRQGFSSELDELRAASSNAREFIAGLERQERERTGIRSLKVGYNKVFGYYIEVTKASMGQVPADYVRRQTLVGGERFITPKLKEYESLILNARERIGELERALYRRVCRQIGERAEDLGTLAGMIAHLDVFAALAEVAARYRYTRPMLNEDDNIEIKEGRHPVVERAMPSGTFVPNDTHLSNGETQLLVLTGPNMSGKSTYIRQVALIVLMAQLGSFVPAESATIGLVDRIFTRVGLHDDLARGESTFMVEMVETATILNQATPRSLVILDEIGRGTSTYDGISLARAVVEHLHNNPRLGCKTLFATHYHELTEMACWLPRVHNFSVAVSEEEGKVVFLHRIVPGGADKSYGIHVAQLAGLPRSVVSRAWEVLEDLEQDQRAPPARAERQRKKEGIQVPLFSDRSALIEELSGLDISNMTPLEAINKLYQLQQKAGEERTEKRE